jgi:hypothetical protein
VYTRRYSGVLLSGTGVLLSSIFNNIKKRDPMSLEFYCRCSSIFAYKETVENYLKCWVLLSELMLVEFFCLSVFLFSFSRQG